MIANYSSVILKPMFCKLMPHKLVEVVKKVLTEEPEPPEKVNLTLDQAMAEFIKKAMNKYSAKRYQSSEEILASLKGYIVASI